MAAGHSLTPARWRAQFDDLMGRIAGRFARVEPRRHARDMLLGLLSDLPIKNCWTLSEQVGDSTPGGMQHLLRKAVWDTDGVRDDLRDYVVEHLGGKDAVLVVDETGDLKKGTCTVGVQRQYTGTAGRIENSQVAVYLTYASSLGHALIDRALYLPKSWADDTERRAAARVPDEVRFATKPALARAMITRALDNGASAPWVAGDEVYGADPRLRDELEERGVGYVLAVACSHHVTTAAGKLRADAIASRLPRRAWQRLSAGDGSKGPRLYDWAWVSIDRRRASGAEVAAHPPQQQHRRAGLLPLLRTRAGAIARAGASGRTPLDRGGIVPGQQGPDRARPAPGAPLGLLAAMDRSGSPTPSSPCSPPPNAPTTQRPTG